MSTKLFKKRMHQIGIIISDIVADFVGSWWFICTYIVCTAAWVMLHRYGIIQVDDASFSLWGRGLAYYTGIQASLLLMNSGRKARQDRQKAESLLKLTKNQVDQISEIVKQIEMLEEVVAEMIPKGEDNGRYN